ncbi:MAG: DUF2917 domain-containing protein [Burkholderiales bacterium]
MIRFSDPRIVALSREDAFVLQNGTGQSLDVLEGEIWLTVEGDPRDYVLAAGERFDVRGPEAIVVTALSPDAVLFRTGAAAVTAERRAPIHETALA